LSIVRGACAPAYRLAGEMADDERDTSAEGVGGVEDTGGGGDASDAIDAAQAAAEEAMSAVSEGGGGGDAFDLPDFGGGEVVGGGSTSERMDLLGDVNLDVTIELGRTRLLVEDVLRLNAGSVVELEKLAGDPVDIFVNGRHVARGEVLVLNDNFCVRVSEVINRNAADEPEPEAASVKPAPDEAGDGADGEGGESEAA